MAFPGTYNFTYYKGDTFEFRISPRNADGTVFDLTGYEAAFTISTARGTAGQSNRRSGYAVISGSDVFCAITPSASDTLPPATSYVYDVEIRKLNATPYPKVYTLLTGNISVQDQVTDVDDNEPEPGESGESGIDVVINPPTNFQILSVTDTTITFDWDPPLAGGAAYVAYLPGYVTVPPDVQIDGQTGLPTNVTFGLPIQVTSGITTHTFTGLSPLTTYRVGVVATDGTNFSNLNASLLVTTAASEESGESGLDIVINPPQNLTVTGTSSTTINIDWDAPAAGGDPFVAYVVGIAPLSNPTNVTTVAQIPISSGITNYQYTGLTPSTSYVVGVVATDGSVSSNPTLSAVPATTQGA